MKRSIATVSLSENLEKKLAAIASAGFEGVEIFENDLLLSGYSPAQVGKIARDLHLKIIALQPFRDFEAMPVSHREKNLERAKRKFETMAELGTDTLLVCSNVSELTIDSPRQSADDLASLADMASQQGFKVGYEALSWGKHVNDYQASWDIVKLADHPALGVVLDTFHILACKSELNTLRTIPKEKITLVQLADAPWMQMDLIQWSRHYRCFPGQGQLPLNAFFDALMATGYDQYASLEIFNDEMRNASCDLIASDGGRSLLWLDEQRVESRPDALPLWDDSHLSILPKPCVEDIGFIELAVDPRDTRFLPLLRAVGFRKTFQHVSKDVDVYQLDGMSFVVNSEPDSFAQASHVTTGNDSCAIGYFCREPEEMVVRARQYGFVPYQANLHAGELPLPAIKSNRGKLVYFSSKDEFFSLLHRYFTPVQPLTSKVSSGGKLHIDHMADYVPFSEFLSTNLFYRTLLGFTISAMPDINDPMGIVVARTAQNENGRVTHNIVLSKSVPSGFPGLFGAQRIAGMQHLAILCDDIFAVAGALDKDVILPIPATYYESIRRHGDVEEGLLNKLESANILVDRMRDGVYFHCYTREVDGVFFEFVQRKNYHGFGEVNAATRHQAQLLLQNVG
ncbi:sugar phosphate isomerase/epimerase and 4-hydroxyphenylpyruvate domain-containing protein [Alteromonas antoniana]|uniref:sugar phosphate isomerase/epimerase and 4-hydroxyphenylpyruvate domain-containing protein n=1 Tax=Alteromonas antoniana TaxID=2803813 RepID=UPI001C4894FF